MATENNKDQITGREQSDFAGTNTNRYGNPKPLEEQDNPINPQEAQNVIDGEERLSGEEADQARRKAMSSKND